MRAARKNALVEAALLGAIAASLALPAMAGAPSSGHPCRTRDHRRCHHPRPRVAVSRRSYSRPEPVQVRPLGATPYCPGCNSRTGTPPSDEPH